MLWFYMSVFESQTSRRSKNMIWVELENCIINTIKVQLPNILNFQ